MRGVVAAEPGQLGALGVDERQVDPRAGRLDARLGPVERGGGGGEIPLRAQDAGPAQLESRPCAVRVPERGDAVLDGRPGAEEIARIEAGIGKLGKRERLDEDSDTVGAHESEGRGELPDGLVRRSSAGEHLPENPGDVDATKGRPDLLDALERTARVAESRLDVTGERRDASQPRFAPGDLLGRTQAPQHLPSVCVRGACLVQTPRVGQVQPAVMMDDGEGLRAEHRNPVTDSGRQQPDHLVRTRQCGREIAEGPVDHAGRVPCPAPEVVDAGRVGDPQQLLAQLACTLRLSLHPERDRVLAGGARHGARGSSRSRHGAVNARASRPQQHARDQVTMTVSE